MGDDWINDFFSQQAMCLYHGMVLNDGIAPSLLKRSLGTYTSYDAQGSVPTSATFDFSISDTRASDAFTGSTLGLKPPLLVRLGPPYPPPL